MKFQYKGHQYELTFDDTPILKEDGLEIKYRTLTILKNYIKDNNLGISVLNGKGVPKNTYTLAKDFLNFINGDKQFALRKSKDINQVEKYKNTKEIMNVSSHVATLMISEKIKTISFNDMAGTSKLLIISCSNKKVSGGGLNNIQNYFLENNVNGEYDDLMESRRVRMTNYKEILLDQPTYFSNSKSASFKWENLIFDSYLQAVDRYAGRFYTAELRNLYREKNLYSNLHILIISGLYGVLEFRDGIIDYHLEINKGRSFWNRKNNYTIKETVEHYIKQNKIAKSHVFYAVSPSVYNKALKPVGEWKSLWISYAKSVNTYYSAECVKAFLQQL